WHSVYSTPVGARGDSAVRTTGPAVPETADPVHPVHGSTSAVIASCARTVAGSWSDPADAATSIGDPGIGAGSSMSWTIQRTRIPCVCAPGTQCTVGTPAASNVIRTSRTRATTGIWTETGVVYALGRRPSPSPRAVIQTVAPSGCGGVSTGPGVATRPARRHAPEPSMGAVIPTA